MSMDCIRIVDLQARCILGISPEERREKQEVLINLTIFADLRKAARSDRFEDAVDYRAIKKTVLAMAEASSFRLVEALAEAIARAVLKSPRVRRVRVRVDKPSALRFARTVSVEIERGKGR